MNESPHPLVNGRVDRDGLLIAADPRFLALQLSAGGDPAGEIAVPQLAALIRLARTLGVPVSRTVVAADGDHDVELWVRAVPEDGSIRLTIGGWQSPEPKEQSNLISEGRAHLSAQLQGDGRWQCDERFVLTDASPELTETLGLDSA